MAFSAFNDFCASKGITAEVVPEDQNSDYESGIATIGGGSWHIRTARNTPTKPGGFTAFWTRSSSGSTEPFDESNVLDGLVVFIKDAERRGIFRFTPTLLIQLGVVRSASSQAPGKRCIQGGVRTSIHKRELRSRPKLLRSWSTDQDV